jgi:hypothetical protein
MYVVRKTKAVIVRNDSKKDRKRREGDIIEQAIVAQSRWVQSTMQAIRYFAFHQRCLYNGLSILIFYDRFCCLCSSFLSFARSFFLSFFLAFLLPFVFLHWWRATQAELHPWTVDNCDQYHSWLFPYFFSSFLFTCSYSTVWKWSSNVESHEHLHRNQFIYV